MYQFGPFSVDPEQRLISHDGTPLNVTPKVFDTLLCLVRNPKRVLTKDELLKEVWPDTFVEEVNLAVNISTLRKALGESAHESRYIVTVPGRGYRFVANVREVTTPGDPQPVLAAGSGSAPQLTFAESKPDAPTSDRSSALSTVSADRHIKPQRGVRRKYSAWGALIAASYQYHKIESLLLIARSAVNWEVRRL